MKKETDYRLVAIGVMLIFVLVLGIVNAKQNKTKIVESNQLHMTLSSYKSLEPGVYRYSEIWVANVDGAPVGVVSVQPIRICAIDHQGKQISLQEKGEALPVIVPLDADICSFSKTNNTGLCKIGTDPEHPEFKKITRFNPFKDKE